MSDEHPLGWSKGWITGLTITAVVALLIIALGFALPPIVRLTKESLASVYPVKEMDELLNTFVQMKTALSEEMSEPELVQMNGILLAQVTALEAYFTKHNEGATAWAKMDADFKRYWDEQTSRVNGYVTSVNMTLALIALVVTALTIGMSINLTLKDAGMQAEIKQAEDKIKTSNGEIAKMKDKLIEADKQVKTATANLDRVQELLVTLDLVEDEEDLTNKTIEKLMAEADGYTKENKLHRAFRRYKEASERLNPLDERLQELFFKCGKRSQELWGQYRNPKRFDKASSFYQVASGFNNGPNYYTLHSTISLASLYHDSYRDKDNKKHLAETVRLGLAFWEGFSKNEDAYKDHPEASAWAFAQLYEIIRTADVIGFEINSIYKLVDKPNFKEIIKKGFGKNGKPSSGYYKSVFIQLLQKIKAERETK